MFGQHLLKVVAAIPEMFILPDHSSKICWHMLTLHHNMFGDFPIAIML